MTPQATRLYPHATEIKVFTYLLTYSIKDRVKLVFKLKIIIIPFS